MTGVVLVVDDQRNMTDLISADLRLRGVETRVAHSAVEAMALIDAQEFDAVLTDVRMPGQTGLQLCEDLVSRRPELPVIVMTAFGSLEAAVAAIRAGAFDFVTKPIEMDLLAVSIKRALDHSHLRRQIRRLESVALTPSPIAGLIAESPPMEKVLSQLPRIAETDAAVLVFGESGTGKELIARALHDHSPRAQRPFIPVNCGAISESLFESELFGHAKGSFTDARSDRQGLMETAQGGTLFFDEIGELPLAMQVKLLRALEERTIRPVGSSREIPVDFRLVSATNRDLEAAVEAGTFREDLYYRINVIQIDLPPLRSRGTDILLIADFFLKQFAKRNTKRVSGFSGPAAEKLLNYNWPGNIRELRNVVERAIALAAHDQIIVEDLPDKIRNSRSSQMVISGDNPSELAPLEQIERQYIQHVLDSCDGNKTMAAKILGLDRKTLYRKLELS